MFPTSTMLLSDLSFLSYFVMELSEFIRYYTRACVDVDDITRFSEIVRDFEHTAIEYDYDAYAALLQRDDISEAKKAVINELLGEFDEGIAF